MAITAAMVKELREMTGAGMMDCKKALTATEGDMDKAMAVSYTHLASAFWDLLLRRKCNSQEKEQSLQSVWKRVSIRFAVSVSGVLPFLFRVIILAVRPQFSTFYEGKMKEKKIKDRYLLIRPLGKGGSGQVWLALDLWEGKELSLIHI